MAYLGSWKIDDYLTFYCNTHDPDTGVATDADAVPSYRIYEDETGAAILNGNMAKLDDGNTTGFYSERVQLTAANGFEKGKQYVVYISATVDSDTGTLHHTWQMEAEVDANTVSGEVTPADGAITAAKIAADAITSSELADGAITAAKLADNAITAAKIAADAITAAKLATGCITSDELAATALTAIADAILKRGAANTEDTADDASLTELIFAAFESKIDGTDWKIYKSDHSTVFKTRTVTKDATATPITEVT